MVEGNSRLLGTGLSTRDYPSFLFSVSGLAIAVGISFNVGLPEWKLKEFSRMIFKSHRYTTQGGIEVSHSLAAIGMDEAVDSIVRRLDTQRGGLLASSYEYPGRYKRWAVGFVNPPLELATRERSFTLRALNDRGVILLLDLAERLARHPQLEACTLDEDTLTGLVCESGAFFPEEQRSRQPSVFAIVRELLGIFASPEDDRLGLYGAFGYDLVFQFENIPMQRTRAKDQRDLVLYLPDELVVVDYYLQNAHRACYDFTTSHGSTEGLPRVGETIDPQGRRLPLERPYDCAPGEYAAGVREAIEYFRRGDLFEVVPSQNFYEPCLESPAEIFRVLQKINPSPYSFLFNLGGEYLIGASPEMFVRVEGRRVETSPISGTIARGQDAIEDAEAIRSLLNSRKDEAELTMCTDVDRNDKSRICEPGSVQVLGRRQIELYSHLIHTVDRVEGLLREEFDALDAFLTHTWAVTVTGAPKRAAMSFIEANERSPRRWYGGAIGYLTFDGNLNTGLVLRTMRLKDGIAEVRAGATLLYDSIPEAEERETLVKAAALFQTIHKIRDRAASIGATHSKTSINGNGRVASPPKGGHVVLVDYEDSFVHTLANYLRACGVTVTTLRHGFPIETLEREQPDLVVLSPGPGRPRDFGVPDMVRLCVERGFPIFGVCLGLQGIVEAFGGDLGILNYPQHGKPSRIFVTDPEALVYRSLPQSFEVGRYHSLFALGDRLPKELKVTAIAQDDTIMSIEHRTLPIAAVQYHPESILSLGGSIGMGIIRNVVQQFAVVSPQLELHS